jgi:hypothetical protein
VPSIADLTLMGDSIRAPIAGVSTEPPVHPSQRLVERYPELAQVPADERGGVFMAKIVAGQVAGSAQAVWIGMLLALLTAGSLALGGTLAAGYLWRRGDGFRGALLPYLEMTLPPTVTLVLFSSWCGISASFATPINGMLLTAMICVSAIMIAGVLWRWPWMLRLSLAFTYIVLLAQSKEDSSMPWVLTVATLALTAHMLVRHHLTHGRSVIVSATR